MTYRSAISGRFVTAKFAKRHPRTTVMETMGNLRKRKLLRGHKLVKRHKPVFRNHKAKAKR